MKAIIASFCLFFSTTLMAFGPEVFKDTYPGYQNYQLLLFSGLKTYFETLPQNSVIHTDQNGIRIFKVKPKNSPTQVSISSKIIRVASHDQITERVIYYLENGRTFDYEIKKTGSDIAPTSDEDLLTFRFMPTFKESRYKVIIPNYKIELSNSKINQLDELSSFSLGFMEMNIQIESKFRDQFAMINYIYFYRGMPNPQATIGVRASSSNEEWSSVSYLHYASNNGEITPKQFFSGLADGARAFTEASTMMAQDILNLGFPKFD